MIEIQLKDLLIDYKKKLYDCLLKYELHGIEDIEEVKETLETIIISLESRAAITISLEEHPIDKFNLATLVTSLINNNFSNKEISETISIKHNIGITPKEIRSWKENYSHLSYEKQKIEERGNVFDVQTRMQDLYNMVYTHLEAIKESEPEDFWKAKTSKQQVILDAMKELRQISSDATKIISMVSHQERLRNFTQIVLETIRETDQATANIILNKLKKHKTLMSVLTPSVN